MMSDFWILEVSLWPGRAHPSMRLVFPKTVSATPTPAMIIFRGGGYASPAGSGAGSAEWAALHGMVGIEVEYATRSTQGYYPANYADAARAVRLIRLQAREWGIDPARIAVMGFSAGGHLASLLSTRPDLPVQPEDDLAGQISARPDIVILAYPLISFVDQYSPGSFAGSVESFFGTDSVSEDRRREFSNDLHVDGEHPPVFVWSTEDDAIVPCTHAQRFADACRRANVPVLFKLYPNGPHGMGLALNERSEVRNWTYTLLGWLSCMGFASEPKTMPGFLSNYANIVKGRRLRNLISPKYKNRYLNIIENFFCIVWEIAILSSIYLIFFVLTCTYRRENWLAPDEED